MNYDMIDSKRSQTENKIIDWFGDLMKVKMTKRQKHGWGHCMRWRDDPVNQLLARHAEEYAEMLTALAKLTYHQHRMSVFTQEDEVMVETALIDDVVDECVDCANLLMMVADRLKNYGGSFPSESASPRL